jgi:hypothetical protein
VVQQTTEKHDPPRATTLEPGPETALTLPVPNMEMFQPRDVQVSLPLILKFRELETARLRDELHKDSGFRLEVPCRESTRAFERLQAAFKTHGLALLIDQVAQARLKQPRLKTNFVLYAEDLTPEELTGILEQVSTEDKKAEARHRGDGQFDALVLAHMNKDDRTELSQLLGVDPAQVQAPRAGTSKPAVRTPEHLALALAYNPVRPRPGSNEVKRFLDSRKSPRPGTVQVLLVLRETKG